MVLRLIMCGLRLVSWCVDSGAHWTLADPVKLLYLRLLRRPVGGTTVSRAPEGCVGPGRPNGVGLVSLIHKLDGLTLSPS